MPVPAAFMDRDGVINDPVLDPEDGRPESPLHAADVRLAAGALEALRRLRAAGLRLVVVSNQPGAAKGKTTCEELRGVHGRVRELLEEGGVEIDGWYYCPHHPRAPAGPLSRPCDCRKPAPGLLLRAAREHDLDLPASWMIGDSDTDVEAGRRAGCRTVLVRHPGSAHRRNGSVRPTFVAPDVMSATAGVVERLR